MCGCDSWRGSWNAVRSWRRIRHFFSADDVSLAECGSTKPDVRGLILHDIKRLKLAIAYYYADQHKPVCGIPTIITKLRFLAWKLPQVDYVHVPVPVPAGSELKRADIAGHVKLGFCNAFPFATSIFLS
jgi:hypothetical protein